VSLVARKARRETREATYAVIVSGKELSVAVLSSRAQDRVPSVELCGGDIVVACEFTAVIAGYCFGVFVAVGHYS
jgi:hypothetical protein